MVADIHDQFHKKAIHDYLCVRKMFLNTAGHPVVYLLNELEMEKNSHNSLNKKQIQVVNLKSQRNFT